MLAVACSPVLEDDDENHICKSGTEPVVAAIRFGNEPPARVDSWSESATYPTDRQTVKKRTSRPVTEDLPDFGVLVFESHHDADFFMSFRTHPFVKFIYVLDGRGALETQVESKSFQTGDLIVIPPKLRHRIEDDAEHPSSLYVACVSLRLLSFDPELAARFRFAVLPDPHLSTRVASVMRRMVYRQQSGEDSMGLSMVSDALRCIEVLVEPKSNQRRKVVRGQSPDEAAMRNYVGHLESHFFEAKSIDEGAAELGMSRRHFTKLFSQVTGETWLNFIRSRAIGHAKHRLATSRIPIASVAFECGFQDLTTFYRQFKRHAGVSPAKYRREQSA